MKRYKFQALVTPYPQPSGSLGTKPPDPSRRLVIRGHHHETHASKFFSGLVTDGGDCPRKSGDGHVILTMLLMGDDALEYFGPGDEFALWLGGDIGRGVVSRRMFT